MSPDPELNIVVPPYRPTWSEVQLASVEYAAGVAACAEFYDLPELMGRAVTGSTVPKSRLRNFGGAAVKALDSFVHPTDIAENFTLQPGFEIIGGGSECLVLVDERDPTTVMKIFGETLKMYYPFMHEFAEAAQRGHEAVKEQFGEAVIPTDFRVEHGLPFKRGGRAHAVVARQPRIEAEIDLLKDLLSNDRSRVIRFVSSLHSHPALRRDVGAFAHTFSSLVAEERFAELPDVLGRWNVVAARGETVDLRLRIIDAQTPDNHTPNNILTLKKRERTEQLATDLTRALGLLAA